MHHRGHRTPPLPADKGHSSNGKMLGGSAVRTKRGTVNVKNGSLGSGYTWNDPGAPWHAQTGAPLWFLYTFLFGGGVEQGGGAERDGG